MSKPTFNLFGDIVQNDADRWFESDVVPAMVVGWLAKHGDADVEININSLGGDVTAGLAIANALKAHKGRTTANVLGVAASMSSVVACACDEVKMGDGAFLMIHNPWTVSVGEAEDLRKDAATLDKMRDSIIAFYQSKTDKSADELKELMDAESWLTFDDLAANGFAVEKYTEELKAAACATHRTFANAPEAARRFFSAVPGDWAKRFSGLQAAKDKEAAALREQLADSEAKHKAALAEYEKMHGDAVAEFSAKIETLNGQLDAMRGDLEKAKADLSSAVARAETAEKDLAEKGEQLDRMTKAHALLTGGVLTPGDGETAEAEYDRELGEAKSAEQREEIRKKHYASAKTKKTK